MIDRVNTDLHDDLTSTNFNKLQPGLSVKRLKYIEIQKRRYFSQGINRQVQGWVNRTTMQKTHAIQPFTSGVSNLCRNRNASTTDKLPVHKLPFCAENLQNLGSRNDGVGTQFNKLSNHSICFEHKPNNIILYDNRHSKEKNNNTEARIFPSNFCSVTLEITTGFHLP